MLAKRRQNGTQLGGQQGQVVFGLEQITHTIGQARPAPLVGAADEVDGKALQLGRLRSDSADRESAGA